MARLRHTILIIAPLTLLFPAWNALASDGAIEIAQSGAGSFPIVISSSGRYVLTSNLQVTNFATSAIRIDVDDVLLDLNGFGIRFVSSGGPAVPGIDATGRRGIRIVDGRVSRFAGDCIVAGDDASVESVLVSECGGRGLFLGTAAIVDRVRATANAGTGIDVAGGRIDRSIARSNGGDGFSTGPGSAVTDSTAEQNGGSGLIGYGQFRGNIARANTGSGIKIYSEASVWQNHLVSNGGFGIDTLSQVCPLAGWPGRVTVGDNHINQNAAGTIGDELTGPGLHCTVNAGGNSCDGSASCP